MTSKIKQQVITAGRVLAETGLIVRTWGNVSARVDDDTFCVTASGRNYMKLTEEEVIDVKISDLSWSGDFKPSSEMLMHREIYRVRPETEFIIHTHQKYASAMGCSGVSDPDKGIVISEYGVSGSRQLAVNVAKAAGKTSGKAIIMKNHGVVTFGRSYKEAFRAAMDLEEKCRILIQKMGVPEECRKEKPYLDDYAMLIGSGDVPDEDREAARLLTVKNAVAAAVAKQYGAAPLDEKNVEYLRKKYIESYSKLENA